MTTTTDTDALTERIRRARFVPAEWARLREGESTGEQIMRHQRRMDEQTAALVAEEVRKAKAEALREMQEHHEREAEKAQTLTARGIHLTIAGGARTRATKYETAHAEAFAQVIEDALGGADSDATPMSAEADVRYRPVRVDPPMPGGHGPNYVADPEAIDAVARAWADAGPVPRVHRAAQKELRRSFPLLAQALDRLTGGRPR